MADFPKKLTQKLANREQANALRKLPASTAAVDFSSNDYLGFARSTAIFEQTHALLASTGMCQNGATGSRLLSGNHSLYTQTEAIVADIHHAETALLFNSGYDANVGFFSAVPQRGDVIFYDEWIHASIRDGIQMSTAKSYKFKHNDLEDLARRLDHELAKKPKDAVIYVVTESVFSMDGDTPDIAALVRMCTEKDCYLVVDEAHAIGVFGQQGVGLLQELGVETQVFARIYTFGKGLGCHGAAILGSAVLRSYLINFARSFIYTTGLSPHAVATIATAYTALQTTPAVQQLRDNIQFFNEQLAQHGLDQIFIPSTTAIHCCVLSGNDTVKRIATVVQQAGFEVKPILSPTVPVGQERLRFCLHAYNSTTEIAEVLALLATFVPQIKHTHP